MKRETGRTFRVANYLVLYVLKKKENTDKLKNTKMPRRPQKPTVVEDKRLIFLVKKKIEQLAR